MKRILIVLLFALVAVPAYSQLSAQKLLLMMSKKKAAVVVPAGAKFFLTADGNKFKTADTKYYKLP